MDGVLHKPFTLATLSSCLTRYPPARLPATPAGTAVVVPAVQASAMTDATGAPLRRIDDLLDPQVLKSFADMAQITGPEPVRRIFGLFREQAPGALAGLQATARAGDGPETARAAHAFKSMCLSIGAKALARRLGEIERLARRDALPGPADIREVGELLERSIVALQPAIAGTSKGDSAAA
jgi:two-component system sensor histidine kinase BarA